MRALRPLELLVRAERRELDREHGSLATVATELDRSAEELARLDGRFGAELEAALVLADGPRLAAAFAAGHRERRAVLVAERERLQAERVRLEDAVRQRAVALKTLELAADELRARLAVEVARADQRRLDDAAVNRYAASMSAASAAGATR